MDNKHSDITNMLVLLAVACILSYDHLGTFKIVALGVGLGASILGVSLYFRRYWGMSATVETLQTGDLRSATPHSYSYHAITDPIVESALVEIVAIPENSLIASRYAICGDSIEELMVRSQQLHQEVISNLLVQLEKSNWETEKAKRLWMNLDYTFAPTASCNAQGVTLGLSLDGRLVTRRSPVGKTKTKASSSQWTFAQPSLSQ